MDPGAFNVLHDTRDKDLLAVADSVYLKLRTGKVFVYQYRIFNILSKDYCHIFLYIGFIEGDYHILTAEDIARTHKYGITDPFGNIKSLFGSHYCKAFGTLNMMKLQKLVKAFPVLSHINAVGRCTENIDSVFAEIFCQFYSSLSAERNNNAVGLFGLDNTHDVFICQRLEIKPVGCIEVGRNRFGVIVYDHYVEACLFQRPYTVNRCIVKFYTLTDTDRSGTEYDNSLTVGILFFYESLRLVILIECRVEVRCFRLELSRAGIDHLIYGDHRIAYLFACQLFDSPVKETEKFCLLIKLVAEFSLGKLVLTFYEIEELFKEPLVYHCNCMDLINGNAASESFIHAE